MNGPPQPDCSLLVLSCDAYSDLWAPFFNLLKRHWPDCPFPIYLGCGTKNFFFPEIRVLKSLGEADWSKCVYDYLAQIPTAYVLIVLDDFFLRDRVENSLIDYALKFAIQTSANQVRLVPLPGPTHRIPGEERIGMCAPGLRYRVSAQATIWRSQALLELLRPGESAWQFEVNASLRSEAQEHGHYAAWRPMLPYIGLFAHHVVEKGCWLPHEKWIFKRQTISCDFGARRTLGWLATIKCQVARLLIKLLSLLPWWLDQRLRVLIRRIVELIAPRALSRLSKIHRE